MSKNEKTLDNAYLIVKGEGEEMEKVSYRTNLIDTFKDDNAVYSEIQHIKTDAKGLRKIADIAEKHGYSIYHLTQL
jgi:hypothetical protein